jgi:hypothetical protein
MKAYLLFAGNNFHANGGINDYQGDFDSLDEAVEFFEAGYYHEWDIDRKSKCEWDWWHIVLSSDMSLVTDSWNGI